MNSADPDQTALFVFWTNYPMVWPLYLHFKVILASENLGTLQ